MPTVRVVLVIGSCFPRVIEAVFTPDACSAIRFLRSRFRSGLTASNISQKARIRPCPTRPRSSLKPAHRPQDAPATAAWPLSFSDRDADFAGMRGMHLDGQDPSRGCMTEQIIPSVLRRMVGGQSRVEIEAIGEKHLHVVLHRATKVPLHRAESVAHMILKTRAPAQPRSYGRLRACAARMPLHAPASLTALRTVSAIFDV